MSSLSSSSSLRLFSPKTPISPSKPLFHSFILSSPVSFQRLDSPSLPQPIKSQQQPPHQSSSLDPSPLPPKLHEIVALFQSVPDSKSKYHQLLHYGRHLPPFNPRFKNDAHRVRGCVSQVWVRAFPDPSDPSAVQFEADSDSALTKGLAALLVSGLSGSPAAVIARVPPEFAHLLGLQQSLTPSRNNGFLNMLKLMQEKGLEIDAGGGESVPSSAQDEILEEENANLGGIADGFGGNSVIDEVSGVNGSGVSVTYDELVVNGDLEAEGDDVGGVDKVPSSLDGGFGGRGERIRERLERELSPIELEVEDISYQHAGHAGVRGSSGGETHFNVRVVSKEFEGKSMVKRHRLVYDLLREELESGLHALSIVAKTPSEIQPS